MLQELPTELLLQILSYSKTVTVLFCLKQVNKRLNELVTSNISILDLVKLTNNSEELEKIIILADFSIDAFKATLVNRHLSAVQSHLVIKLAKFARNGKELDIIINMKKFNATAISSILTHSKVEIISQVSITKLAKLTNSISQLNRIIRLIGFENTACSAALANSNVDISMLDPYSIFKLKFLTNNTQEWEQVIQLFNKLSIKDQQLPQLKMRF